MPKQKQPSRRQRWEEAVAKARDAWSDAEDAKGRLGEALDEVREVQSEYENWRDNIPENLQQSAVYEKLEMICDLDLDLVENLDVDSIDSGLSELENADFPMGFGRD